MSSSDPTDTPSNSKDGSELMDPKNLLDPKMLIFPGDKTPEEARLEREGCIRTLQVFRYNLFQKESKVHQVDAFADLLYYEEEIRRNCQEEIALKQKLKDDLDIWGPDLPSFDKEMSRLHQENWLSTRYWWYTRGWIIGNSGPL
ncbi:hypothetical protein N7533_001700 [Penicillium manginii]|uniref:uncharacterized protein n=1 Tax=Penicillium manginii TaxID=203109 RepID=UPI0025475B20|nr:uncharacterized protein N7533_001700 [Penicillium manginii]KAJ5763019.1 hypothetical protein N7533_001700 [Penicillium manginii]